ncbi:MAG: MBL fold metallo-hydrolase [Acidimicrobiaceae bacterium]|nr:MBL fold metallo-hydrolase [Acidimicrobiaceae bacterium]
MATPPSGPTLTFLGGARTVTGSKTLLETGDTRVLIDCGVFQGRKELRLANWAEFPVDPASIDAVVLTHAHVDHSGYVPRLCRAGFRGPVYATGGTCDLAAIVLPDSGHLHEEEAAFANRKGYSKHHPAQPLYTEADAVRSLAQFVPVGFGERRTVAAGIDVEWTRAGHILGAASLHVDVGDRRLVFSGDLGRAGHPLLLPPDPIGAADVVVVESTYGDRAHLDVDAAAALTLVVNDTARQGGVVIIPAFAVDRTEVVLWHLDQLVERGDIPNLPIFVDSPMASRALDVYRNGRLRGSPEFRPGVADRPLFPSLDITETPTTEASKSLNARHGPFVIVSASGMATGGRVLHHLADRIGDSRNAVVLVGFQAPGTRGDQLRHGADRIKMFGSEYRVAADVVSIELSSHADRSELLAWLATADDPDLVLVNHGEPDAAASLADAVHERLGVPAMVPAPGERVAVPPRTR